MPEICKWEVARGHKWIAYLRVDWQVFTSEKSWRIEKAVTLDTADLACYWIVLGRTLKMAPMLSFEDMPAHCVVRPAKVKRDLEEERHSDLGSALQGVCLAEDENMVSSYSFVSPWRYQFQGSKSATPILVHHEHRP